MEKQIIKCPSSFFFCGSAWSIPFLIGVYKGMVQKWGYVTLSKCKFGGNSGGALIALCATLGFSYDEVEYIYNKLLHIANLYGAFGKISIYNSITIYDILKNKNDYKKVNNKLFVGVTRFFNKSVTISNWNNNEELIDTVHASMHIPFYSTYIKLFKPNLMIVDGGFSSTYNKIDNNTLIINPITTNGHITYTISLLKCMIPLNKEKSNELLKSGIDQMVTWDGHYNNLESKPSVSNTIMCLVWIFRYCEEISVYHILCFTGFMYFLYWTG